MDWFEIFDQGFREGKADLGQRVRIDADEPQFAQRNDVTKSEKKKGISSQDTTMSLPGEGAWTAEALIKGEERLFGYFPVGPWNLNTAQPRTHF